VEEQREGRGGRKTLGKSPSSRDLRELLLGSLEEGGAAAQAVKLLDLYVVPVPQFKEAKATLSELEEHPQWRYEPHTDTHYRNYRSSLYNVLVTQIARNVQDGECDVYEVTWKNHFLYLEELTRTPQLPHLGVIHELPGGCTQKKVFLPAMRVMEFWGSVCAKLISEANLLGEGRVPAVITEPSLADALRSKEKELRVLQGEFDRMRDAEAELSQAYVRLREILGTVKTEYPDYKECWEATEARARVMVDVLRHYSIIDVQRSRCRPLPPDVDVQEVERQAAATRLEYYLNYGPPELAEGRVGPPYTDSPKRPPGDILHWDCLAPPNLEE